MAHLGIAQETKLDIEFEHEWTLSKFLNIHVTGKGTRKFEARTPYVHSGTLDLTINLQGKILHVDFIEKNEKEDMNTFFKLLAMETDGLWNPVNVPNGTESVHVIIPILYRTKPEFDKDDRPDLIQQFQEYHQGLNISQLEVCKNSPCALKPETLIVTYPSVR